MAQADQVFSQYKPKLKNREYTASRLYFYQYYADLLKAKGDYSGYAIAQEKFYVIKDSLINLTLGALPLK
ncbi:hypothetical protein [Spirosoma gilvum]